MRLALDERREIPLTTMPPQRDSPPGLVQRQQSLAPTPKSLVRVPVLGGQILKSAYAPAVTPDLSGSLGEGCLHG